MSTPEPSGPALLDPDEGITQPVSTMRVGIGYQIALFLGQFGLFVALMAPVYVSMQLKAQALVGEDAATVIGSVLPIGAFGALLMNPARRCPVRPNPHALGAAVGRGSSVAWSSSRSPSSGSPTRPTSST